MDEMMGVIKLFAGNFAPRGWLFCQGQELPIQQYTAIFSLLGTTYGGNGTTTFKLPDLRSRVPVGTGQGPGLSNRTLGQSSGAESATAQGTTQFALTVNNLPSHSHAISGEVKVGVADQIGVVSAAPNNVLGKKAIDKDVTPNTTVEMYVGAAAATFNDGNKLGGVSHNLTAANIGSGAPVSVPVSVNVPVVQPFLGMNYIICMEGIYPSRP